MAIPWETNIIPSLLNKIKGDIKMIGIYKITNKTNNKAYVGQSNDIKRRFKEHQTCGRRSRIPLSLAIEKYGAENFIYEILEECSIEELNDKETYWITTLQTHLTGYNCNVGGEQASVGEANGRAKLTIEDIKAIRQAYNEHKKQKEVYENYKELVSFNHFQNIWQGRVWPHIMPEVFTEENKKYYIYENSKGANSKIAKFTDEEIIIMRKRYVNESAKVIYEDYKDKISFQSFQQILWGRYYDNLPIYKKKEKKWVNI